MTNLTTKLATIACTIVLSTVMVLGAVAPAHLTAADTAIARTVA